VTLKGVAFGCVYVLFVVLSVFAILAPRTLLVRLHGELWLWVLLIPVVLWFYGFLRTLYRGGE